MPNLFHLATPTGSALKGFATPDKGNIAGAWRWPLLTASIFAWGLALAPDQVSGQGATGGTYAAGIIGQPAQGNPSGGASASAFGSGAVASGSNSTALGASGAASADNATAVGQGSQATGLSSTALGSGGVGSRATIATPGFSTAVGTGSQVNGNSTGATAVGDNNTIATNASFSQAFGNFNTVSGANATAVGTGNIASGARSSALGDAALASGDDSIAFGTLSGAPGVGAVAIGRQANAVSDGSVALGNASTASGVNAVAIGQGSTAGFVNSAAIGQGVATTRANQIAVGGATNTYTLAGITSASSTAAQSGPTEFVTTDLSGNLAAMNVGPGDVTALNGRVDRLASSLNSLRGYARSSRAEARGGTALAVAASQIRYDDRPGKVSVGTSLGEFLGEGGSALGIGYTSPNQRVRLNAAGSSSFRGDVGFGGGVSFTLN